LSGDESEAHDSRHGWVCALLLDRVDPNLDGPENITGGGFFFAYTCWYDYDTIRVDSRLCVDRHAEVALDTRKYQSLLYHGKQALGCDRD
jgi:hypothetical protein